MTLFKLLILAVAVLLLLYGLLRVMLAYVLWAGL